MKGLLQKEGVPLGISLSAFYLKTITKIIVTM